MGLFASVTAYAAPVFLIASPILTYTDQAMSMHRSGSSAGFSLDIPLIMLVASICRLFYWPGARFDTALLVQAFCNIFIQLVVLKVALDNRPGHSSKGGEAAVPFAGVRDGGGSGSGGGGFQRPFNFWRWRSDKPYWKTLLYLFITLLALELLLEPLTPIYAKYSDLVGYVGLAVEATLPLPQLYSNYRSRSCRGFRLSVLINWLLGDSMKMFWFFTGKPGAIPWPFKLCGIFQAACDALIGFQYLLYGDGDSPPAIPPQTWQPIAAATKSRAAAALPAWLPSPGGRGEKDN
ncbi:solute carrier family 66 member 2 [Microdochium nivale]|nr:solute carrier family 66 member 2 [Microdochium nivale]